MCMVLIVEHACSEHSLKGVVSSLVLDHACWLCPAHGGREGGNFQLIYTGCCWVVL